MSIALPVHAAGLSLTHNEHKTVYRSAADWIDDIESLCGEMQWTSDAEKALAIARDSIWQLHWYPVTPVGFHAVYASTLGAILDWVARHWDEVETH
jgi:hypothetical protein